jgi:hypothetical protein
LIDDERLRAIWAALPPGGAHVSEAEWERFACGELGPAARARIVDHVVACAACAGAYRAVSALSGAARELDPALPAPARAPRRAGWIAGAVLVAAAAVLALFIGQRRPPAPEVVRGTGPATFELAAPVGVRVSWRPVDGAEAYRARLVADDGTPLFTTETTATEATWPAARPGRYSWMIEALRGGAVIGRSRVESFVVDR